MLITHLSTCLFISLIFVLLWSGCTNNGSPSSSPPFNPTKNNKPKGSPTNHGKLTFIGQIKAGPVTAGINIDEKGQISFTTGLSPIVSIPLGIVTLDFGIKDTISLTEEKPHQLFILIKDSSNVVHRYQYDIGQKFVFKATNVEEVTVINENDCTIIAVTHPQSYTTSDETQETDNQTGDQNYGITFIVNTRNHSGLNLRAEKDIESESIKYIPEGGSVIFYGCAPEKTRINGTDRRLGRWCKVAYDGAEGWVWGWYIKKPDS